MACLQAGAASALGFNFTFTGFGFPTSPATVTGTVGGLVDNFSNQITGVTVTVTGATNSGLLPEVFADVDSFLGDGFDVSGGQITGVDIRYFNALNAHTLDLGNNNSESLLFNSYDGGPFGIFQNTDNDPSPLNSLRFTPITAASSSVPSPIPLFGAAAAFGWSRQLRRRIKTSV